MYASVCYFYVQWHPQKGYCYRFDVCLWFSILYHDDMKKFDSIKYYGEECIFTGDSLN